MSTVPSTAKFATYLFALVLDLNLSTGTENILFALLH